MDPITGPADAPADATASDLTRRAGLARAAGTGLLVAAGAYLCQPLVVAAYAATGSSMLPADPLERTSLHAMGVFELIVFATIAVGLVVAGSALAMLLPASVAARAGSGFAIAAATGWFLTGAVQGIWMNAVLLPQVSEFTSDSAMRTTAAWAAQLTGAAAPLAAGLGGLAFLVAGVAVAARRAGLVGRGTVITAWSVAGVAMAAIAVGILPAITLSLVAWAVAGVALIRSSRTLRRA